MPNKMIVELLKKRNVVSVGKGTKIVKGIDTGETAIVVGVCRKVALRQLLPKDLIPLNIEGVKTDVVEVGELKLLQNPTEKFRPCPGGVSCGHYMITTGTLGCWVKKDGQYMILSNNHVLANMNEGRVGDPIYQPGPYDGGGPLDCIGHLYSYKEISILEPSDCGAAKVTAGILNFLAAILRRQTRLVPVNPPLTNLVDCALAKPVTEDLVLDTILGLGDISDTAELSVGESVWKSGRSSGVTIGRVTQIDVVANVQVGEGKLALFEDQVLISTSNFSEPGDSGSAILTVDNKLAGLLFAGGEGVTLANRYANVKEALGIDER